MNNNADLNLLSQGDLSYILEQDTNSKNLLKSLDSI
jgi:hypothetical protein